MVYNNNNNNNYIQSFLSCLGESGTGYDIYTCSFTAYVSTTSQVANTVTGLKDTNFILLYLTYIICRQ